MSTSYKSVAKSDADPSYSEHDSRIAGNAVIDITDENDNYDNWHNATKPRRHTNSQAADNSGFLNERTNTHHAVVQMVINDASKDYFEKEWIPAIPA
jgi:hypothetical protein